MKYQGVVSKAPLFFDKRHRVSFATEVCLVKPNTSDKFKCAVEEPPGGAAGRRQRGLKSIRKTSPAHCGASEYPSARVWRLVEIFIQQLVNSLSVASVIILIGIGITLIFGLTGIINFAHGEFLMIGGMTTWVCRRRRRQLLCRRCSPRPSWSVCSGFVARTRALPLHARSADERFHRFARPHRHAADVGGPLLQLLSEGDPAAVCRRHGGSAASASSSCARLSFSSPPRSSR